MRDASIDRCSLFKTGEVMMIATSRSIQGVVDLAKEPAAVQGVVLPGKQPKKNSSPNIILNGQLPPPTEPPKNGLEH